MLRKYESNFYGNISIGCWVTKNTKDYKGHKGEIKSQIFILSQGISEGAREWSFDISSSQCPGSAAEVLHDGMNDERSVATGDDSSKQLSK